MSEDNKKMAEYLADYLKSRKIKTVFGIIGAGDVHIFDAITCEGYTDIVCVHHEQAAVMAAQTYYRVTGEPTAAIVTTGGGSSNAVTGVVGAWMDSVPVVIISGNEKSVHAHADNPHRGWGVQGYDSSAMVEKVTKYAARVNVANEMLSEVEKAFYIAEQGRKGPCWIDIPMDLQAKRFPKDEVKHFDEECYVENVLDASRHPDISSDLEKNILTIISMLAKAERPLLWLGQGIRLAGGTNYIEPLLDAFCIPALVSWSGIDMVDSNHPLVFGRAGVYGQRAANLIVQNSDLVLAIGTRLAIPQVGYEINEFAREAELVQVDIDPVELSKYPDRSILRLQADAKAFLKALIEKSTISNKTYAPWLAQCEKYRNKYPFIGPEHADRDGFINSYQFMERFNEYFHDDEIIVTDMGTALLSGHQTLKIKKQQRLMTSQGLGEMGFGLPGAIGASFAADRRRVICLNCDGGMMMNLQELQTIVHHDLPIKIIVFNNDGYLMIKHTQKALFKGRYSGTDKKSGVSCPNYTKLAKAFGIKDYQVHTWEDFHRVVPKMMSEDGAAICEVFMGSEQLFVPKLSLAQKADGTLVSPPLEDLSPLLDRQTLAEDMVIPMHPKSKTLGN